MRVMLKRKAMRHKSAQIKSPAVMAGLSAINEAA
jgi:hypothetical protein